jgi:DNA-binding response OmpR family regulator
MNLLLVSSDLLIGSQVTGAVARVGASMHVARDATQAAESCGQQQIDLALLDLSTIATDIATLVAQLRACEAPPARIVAFGPHVHAAKLQAARDAGCDDVVSRGELHARLDQMLKS